MYSELGFEPDIVTFELTTEFVVLIEKYHLTNSSNEVPSEVDALFEAVFLVMMWAYQELIINWPHYNLLKFKIAVLWSTSTFVVFYRTKLYFNETHRIIILTTNSVLFLLREKFKKIEKFQQID